ncbi:sulfotransferase [Sphingomonas parva]|uniref:Sulfotransferase n=1 Tax=Sphingomonas parva TaxID=2555898 RepID=A0A4Y8ZW94_9SPHN|nr:sulfotransferase [Sphingomonas parva]TFI60298.1 sulfotransferase [Sphingomonas parva]
MARLTVRRLLERYRLSPVWWANLGPFSAFIAKRSVPQLQPLLIVSHPRSGSTWVGRTLGRSASALYLHEPLTLSHLQRDPGSPVFAFAAGLPPPLYAGAASAAAIALPAFPPNIVSSPSQWTLTGRCRKRLVVKEVNPLSIGWLARLLSARVVYLVRHPAGVAASFARMGWLEDLGPVGLERRFGRRKAAELQADPRLRSVWHRMGAVQALVHRQAADQLATVASSTVVQYEDLCTTPQSGFRSLCEFAGLAWDSAIEETVARDCFVADHEPRDSYGVVRNSRQMRAAWRQDLGQAELRDLREGYQAIGAPFYAADHWWEP